MDMQSRRRWRLYRCQCLNHSPNSGKKEEATDQQLQSVEFHPHIQSNTLAQAKAETNC